MPSTQKQSIVSTQGGAHSKSYILDANDAQDEEVTIGLDTYEFLLESSQSGDIPSEAALVFLFVLLYKNFPRNGVPELIEAAKDIFEFYDSLHRSNPTPLPEPEEFSIEF